jgi:glyoxylase-like metal-dependent hydrolase (beta-lactamase superfamily II)
MTKPSARVLTVDSGYIQAQFAASYLRVEATSSDIELAWIDTATAQSVPHLLASMEAEGFSAEQVRWIIVTHAHLDHAGGAGALAVHCKNAKILAHPRAARHLIDPSRLEASARKVYGDDSFESLYGSRLIGVPADRVVAMEDGAEVELGRSKLHFLHTRGHANHHFCVFDATLATVFTGDSFGLRYPTLQRDGLFVFPSTSPTDFDGPEALKTLDKILGLQVKSFFPTHFGQVFEVSDSASQLRLHLQQSIDCVARASRDYAPQELESRLYQDLVGYYRDFLEAKGQFFGAREWVQLELDLKLNAAGLAHCVRKIWESANRELS